MLLFFPILCQTHYPFTTHVISLLLCGSLAHNSVLHEVEIKATFLESESSSNGISIKTHPRESRSCEKLIVCNFSKFLGRLSDSDFASNGYNALS